jgi:hypothetical protein
LVSSFHSPGGKNTIFVGKYLPAPEPNETRAFYVYIYGKIQIMKRCNFREIWKEIGGSEIHPQAFYSELFMNYVISPGREFADGCRIRGHDPNSPEFGIVSPLVLNSAPSANSLLEETTQFMNNSDHLTSRKAHVKFIKGTCDEMPLLPGG